MDSRPSGPHQTLHIALVIPDRKLFRVLSKNAYLLQDPTRRDVGVKLHVIEARKGTDPQEVLAKHSLVALGLVSPEVAGLQYPEEIELGWSHDPSSDDAKD